MKPKILLMKGGRKASPPPKIRTLSSFGQDELIVQTTPHPVDNFALSAATQEYGLNPLRIDDPSTNGDKNISATDQKSPLLANGGFAFSWPGIHDTVCSFRVRISGVQCRNLQARKLRGTSDPFVTFSWAGQDSEWNGEKNVPFVTPVIKGDLNPTWKGLTFTFEYESTVSVLKEKTLRVEVYSQRTFGSKSLIGYAEVDLYTIATGAVHHDHHLKGSDTGRVVFNCYMEQISEWEMQVKNVGVALPSIQDEMDRAEGHDFQEDSSLPLKKYAVSYKCTIGTNETFYMGDGLKAPQEDCEGVSSLSFQSQARLKILSRKARALRHSQVAPPGSGSKKKKKQIGSSGSAEKRKPVMKDGSSSSIMDPEDHLENPVGVSWNAEDDRLPSITRYSTFDEVMSATLKLEVRCLMIGRGQMSMNPDNRFIQMYDKYCQKLAENQRKQLASSDDIRNTWLFGQSWLSLEKLFQDAMQDRVRNPTPGSGDDSMFGNSAEELTTHFEQSLALKGHQCGYVFGTIVFTKVPNVRQLRSGVISERGVSASSSVIVGAPGKKGKKGVNLPEEATRMLDKMNGLFELMLVRHKDEKESKIRKATKILRVLQTSHKASMLSWVYNSREALHETKNILVRLWEFLLENIRVRDYTLRNIFYELLFYLVKRAELSDLPLLGFDSIVNQTTGKTEPPSEQDIAFGLKLRAMLLETKCCVLQAVSVRGVLNNNFMFFVARMLSILCFRLPSFGVELYQLWAQSYIEPVEELAGEFRTNADADLFAMDGLEAHLDWRRFHKAVFDKYGSETLKAQEEDAEEKYEVTPGACKARLSRLSGEANTLNILLVDQWLWYVLDTLAVLNQKIGWSHLPGYAQILKVFFLELRFQQRSGRLSPALYKLSCTMLSNTAMINPMTKFLLSKTNVHHVQVVISAVELLGVWIYMIRSWRVRLSSYRLSHLETNDRWNFHQDAQYSIPSGDEVSLLPPSFDYRFLESCIRVLLLSEHTQVVLITLEFLYNSWDCFPERHADKLRYELQRVFFKLFLHWNNDIRHFYHTVLAFRAMKPHAWTQKGSSFVHTPPQSRRHIDAVAADFNMTLGPDELLQNSKRSRSYSASNLMESVGRKLTETLSSSSSPRSSLSSPRSAGGMSPRASGFASSPRATAQRIERKVSADLTTYENGFFRSDRKSRSVSDDYSRESPAVIESKLDPSLQLRYNRLLERIYDSTQNYISRSDSVVAHAVPDGGKRRRGVGASWKKKGMLLKQGTIYKNAWSQKYFSLQNNKLGYADSELGAIKREISIARAKISEIPNQIDQTHGTRIVLNHCFMVEQGSQKLTLCAPSFEEMREWIELLSQNAVDGGKTVTGEEHADGEWKLSDLSLELECISGQHSPVGEIDEALMPYTILAMKEWLVLRMSASDAQMCIESGQTPTLPVLLSKSSSYSDNE